MVNEIKMIALINIALMLIAMGVAADNLMIASISGNGFASFKLLQSDTDNRNSRTRNSHWYLMLVFVFIIQSQVLQYGDWFGGLTKKILNGNEQWWAIAIVFSMGVRMLQELKMKNKILLHFSFQTNTFLGLALSTSIYVFAFGCSMHWLGMNDGNVSYTLLPLLIFFLITGMVLGKYHFIKTLKCLHISAAILVIIGSVVLIVQKLNVQL